MDASEVRGLLGQSKLFSLLDEQGRARLAELAIDVEHPGDTTIVTENAISDSFFVIVDGAVDVFADKFGEKTQLASLGSGAVFGEIGALTREPRTATIASSSPVQLLRFDAKSVLAILEDYPDALATLRRLGLQRSEETLEIMLGD